MLVKNFDHRNVSCSQKKYNSFKITIVLMRSKGILIDQNMENQYEGMTQEISGCQSLSFALNCPEC